MGVNLCFFLCSPLFLLQASLGDIVPGDGVGLFLEEAAFARLQLLVLLLRMGGVNLLVGTGNEQGHLECR
jgi:hypothetical protein